MRKMALIAVAALIFAGCRTTEENYQSSYETAIQKMKEKEADGVDRTTYNKIIDRQKPKESVVGGDTVAVAGGYAWQFYGDRYPLKKYNVVVGAMKQQFNAKAFCDRLQQAGCEAYVITDREKNYYVVAAGFNNEQMAADYLRDIEKHIPFKLPIDEPYIYDTSRIYVKP